MFNVAEGWLDNEITPTKRRAKPIQTTKDVRFPIKLTVAFGKISAPHPPQRLAEEDPPPEHGRFLLLCEDTPEHPEPADPQGSRRNVAFVAGRAKKCGPAENYRIALGSMNTKGSVNNS
jgi:hypothetical protein